MPKLECVVIVPCFVTGELHRGELREQLLDQRVEPDSVVTIDASHPRRSKHIGEWMKPVAGYDDDGEKLGKKAFDALVASTGGVGPSKEGSVEQRVAEAVEKAVAEQEKLRQDERAAIKAEFEQRVAEEVAKQMEKLTAPQSDGGKKK